MPSPPLPEDVKYEDIIALSRDANPARQVVRVSEDRQPLKQDGDEENLELPFFPDGLPRTFKEDLDSIPAIPGTSRKCKLFCLAVLLGCILIGVIALAFALERMTHQRVEDNTDEDRDSWFGKGAFGLPPGYCEEHAMVFPEDNIVDHVAWAKTLVEKMTEEEKYRLIHGVGFDGFKARHGFYVGNVLAIPRLGIPSIKMQDGTAGFRTTDEEMIGQVTSWPCSLTLTASWDPDLVEEWATAAGKEFRAKGANMALGPAVNVHRVAFSGRNAEFISGEDPTLGRILAPAYVKGMQEGAGVAAVVKHFVLNEQETQRTSSNSKAGNRVRWEHYYPPFESSVRAGVASVMCSYNLVNGQQACSSSETVMNDLKGMMGFEGWVMSDWWAIKSDQAAASGTDMDMPGNDGLYSQEKLEGVLQPGRLDHMVERVLVGMSRSGAWSNLPGDDCRVGCNCDGPLYSVVATSDEHRALARKVATMGAVMLKNEISPKSGDRVLPIRKKQKVAIVGGACGIKPNVKQQIKSWTEASYYTLGGSSRVLSPHTVSLLDALKQESDLELLISYGDEPQEAVKQMVRADVTIVCGGATATETVDRRTLRLDQDVFVGQVISAGVQIKVPVVVLVYAPGAVLLPWSDKATAILLMFPSGQETGLAAADLLRGRESPSGKLPVTIPVKEEDAVRPCPAKDCPYQDGLKGGWHIYDGKPVKFPFGFGLSYATFDYIPGALGDLREDSSRYLSFSVKNVGTLPGADIVQLYIRFPATTPSVAQEPEMVLRRFVRTRVLQPGEAQDITIQIGPRDEMIWDTSLASWKMIFGKFSVGLGTSSRDLRLCGAYNNELGVIETPDVPMTKCKSPFYLPAADGR